MHQCPGPKCARVVSDEMLACRRHWYQVSRVTRSWVWRTYAHGNGMGSDKHNEAIVQAISEMSE